MKMYEKKIGHHGNPTIDFWHHRLAARSWVQISLTSWKMIIS